MTAAVNIAISTSAESRRTKGVQRRPSERLNSTIPAALI